MDVRGCHDLGEVAYFGPGSGDEPKANSRTLGRDSLLQTATPAGSCISPHPLISALTSPIHTFLNISTLPLTHPYIPQHIHTPFNPSIHSSTYPYPFYLTIHSSTYPYPFYPTIHSSTYPHLFTPSINSSTYPHQYIFILAIRDYEYYTACYMR